MQDSHRSTLEPAGSELKADRAVIPIDMQAILLDLDGTLVETDNRWATLFAARLAPLKRLRPDPDTAALGRALVMGLEMPGNYLVSALERLGLASALSGVADRLRRSKGLATRETSELVAGSERLVAELVERYALAVVTTRARREALAFLAQTSLARYFRVVITRQDVFRMKPHPAPIRRAAELLGVSPSRCAMVGDTVMDIVAAQRAGAYAVGVLSGFGSCGELEKAGAQMILDRAELLLDHLPQRDKE